MPELIRDGVPLNFEVLGSSGPFVVLTPGGRNDLENVRGVATAIASDGYRVLLHDRRNCGKSGLWFDAGTSEQEIWVEDVVALLDHIGADRVIAGGGSAGCRLSLLLAIRYPERVSALLLWWVTGGHTAARELGHAYYGQYIELAEAGGMDAVAASEFFAERIEARPGNRALLMGQSVEAFTETMRAWRDFFDEGADLPVIGATAAQLQQIDVPTCIVPGSDDIHPRRVAEELHSLLPDSQFEFPFPREELPDIKRMPLEAIMERFQERLGVIFRGFLTERGIGRDGRI